MRLQCADNEGYEEFLTIGKFYEVIDHNDLEQYQLVSLLDDTGEEYCYLMERFLVVGSEEDKSTNPHSAIRNR